MPLRHYRVPILQFFARQATASGHAMTSFCERVIGQRGGVDARKAHVGAPALHRSGSITGALASIDRWPVATYRVATSPCLLTVINGFVMNIRLVTACLLRSS